MDRDLPLIPSLIFITSLLVSIGLYMQQTPHLHRMPISQIFTDSNGKVQLLNRNEIVDLRDEFTAIDLSSVGVDQHVGKIIKLKSGDLLINTAGQNTSLVHKLQRYKRQTEVSPSYTGSSLLKCDAQVLDCQAWGSSELEFNTPWMGTELPDGYLIIADTGRHIVHLVTADGRVVSTLENFYFPNDISLSGSRIWLTNTNTNQLIRLARRGEELFRTDDSNWLSVITTIDPERRFPSRAIPYEKSWAVLTHKNGMNAGAIFIVKGDVATRVHKELKDITAMELIDDNLYAADFNDNSVWSLNLNTRDNSQVRSTSLDRSNERIAENIADNRLRFGGLLFLIMGLGVTALVLSLLRSKPNAGRQD